MAEDEQAPPATEAIENITTPSQPTPFIPPTIHHETLLSGASYTHFSAVPPYLLPPVSSPNTPEAEKKQGVPCCLGIDEAGRGPVLGPMVYGTYYLPISLHRSLLADTHGFDDSKVLKPEFRAELMERICTPPTTLSKDSEKETPDEKCLFSNSGYGVSVLSAASISAAMLAPSPYNLNAQAVDATIGLIRGVIERGVNVREIFIDTIGQPGPYQVRLERVFPGRRVTVEKKADSLYPVVSAASVVAKVTRDVGLEGMYGGLYGNVALGEEEWEEKRGEEEVKEEVRSRKRKAEVVDADWGSGYPSDVRCTSWLKRNMNPVFGWGTECRFSWGTCKDLLEKKDMAVPVDWPVDVDEDTRTMTDYFTGNMGETKEEKEGREVGEWFGGRVGIDAF